MGSRRMSRNTPELTARLMLSGVALAAFVALAMPAGAQDQAGRYTMKDIEDGMLRLDTLTGEVSYCTKKDDNWVCNAAEDNRSALADEVTRLQEENAALRNRLVQLEKRDTSDDRVNLPNDEDMEKVVNFMERLMRRFYAFTQSLRDQIEDGKYGEKT